MEIDEIIKSFGRKVVDQTTASINAIGKLEHAPFVCYTFSGATDCWQGRLVCI